MTMMRRMPVNRSSRPSHEFRYRDPVIGDDTLVVSISQSGETMDTLMAVKYARVQRGDLGDERLRGCHGDLGPRVGVDHGIRLARDRLHVGRLRGVLSAAESADHVRELEAVPAKIQRVLDGM
jgi:glucosamine--fructose-6-phosphate aminotransferase (isomerizing)